MKTNWFSRKFIAWIVWTILTGCALFMPKDIPLDVVIQYYGLVTLLYIGGNVAQKYVENRVAKPSLPEGK